MTSRRPTPRRWTIALAAIATFLVLLAMLSLQLHAGHDPALGRATSPVALQAGTHRGPPVVTRTSGSSSSATQPTGASHAAVHHHAVVTRSSGAGEGEDD